MKLFFFFSFFVIQQLQHEEAKFLEGQSEHLQQQQDSNLHSLNQGSTELQSEKKLLEHSHVKQQRNCSSYKQFNNVGIEILDAAVNPTNSDFCSQISKWENITEDLDSEAESVEEEYDHTVSVGNPTATYNQKGACWIINILLLLVYLLQAGSESEIYSDFESDLEMDQEGETAEVINHQVEQLKEAHKKLLAEVEVLQKAKREIMHSLQQQVKNATNLPVCDDSDEDKTLKKKKGSRFCWSRNDPSCPLVVQLSGRLRFFVALDNSMLTELKDPRWSQSGRPWDGNIETLREDVSTRSHSHKTDKNNTQQRAAI